MNYFDEYVLIRYVLPFIESPQDDQEFSPYFSQKWIDTLKITLHNFLSVVLSTAPLPKLILLERWFKSEAQQQMRLQLKQSFQRVNVLIQRLDKNEERLMALRDAVKDLTTHLIKATLGGLSHLSVGLFEENDAETESKRQQVKEIGLLISSLAIECSNKGHQIMTLSHEERLRAILGTEASSQYFGALNETRKLDNLFAVEDLEKNLLSQLNIWLRKLSAC